MSQKYTVLSGSKNSGREASGDSGRGSLCERNRTIVKIFDANGVEQACFEVMDTRYGVNVTVGYLGL